MAELQTEEYVTSIRADGLALVLDVFIPTGPKNGLAIIDVVSGAWHSDRGKIEEHRRAKFFDAALNLPQLESVRAPAQSHEHAAHNPVLCDAPSGGS